MIKFPSKTIIVAYDPSDASRTAWRHAAALAETCGAALEVVFVNPWENSLGPPPSPIPSQVRALRAQIRAVVGKGPKITILQGDPAHRIVSWTRRRGPDLLVVGTHGRSGLKRALLGSVAEAVVRGSSIPVLVARGSVAPIRSILAVEGQLKRDTLLLKITDI